METPNKFMVYGNLVFFGTATLLSVVATFLSIKNGYWFASLVSFFVLLLCSQLYGKAEAVYELYKEVEGG